MCREWIGEQKGRQHSECNLLVKMKINMWRDCFRKETLSFDISFLFPVPYPCLRGSLASPVSPPANDFVSFLYHVIFY